MNKFIGKCLLIKTGDKKILAVGDLHIGYEEALNRVGVYISRKMFSEMISEFEEVFKRVGKIDEIVLLGDIKHEFSDNNLQEWNEILKLIDYLYEKSEKIIIIRGNHDNYLKNIANKKEVDVLDYYVYNGFCFLHGDRDFIENYDPKIKYWIVGHGHPALRLEDEIKSEKYKCFLCGNYKDKKVIIVPSFFGLVEGVDFREEEGKFAWEFDLKNFQAYVCGEGLEVLDFGKLGEI